LLEASQAALQHWNSAPNSADSVDALKRPLHTLKGGARMAGISAMGDLAHELESLVIQISYGNVASDDRARGIAQQVLDDLARMREQVAAGRPVASARGLIERIHAVASGAAPAAETMAAPPEPAEVVAALPVEAPEAAMPMPPVMEVAEQAQPAPPAVPEPLPPVAAITALEPPTAPAMVPPGREPVGQPERGEMARVSAELLDQLLNNAGEVSIARARLEQQLGSIEFNLGELSRTVVRLKEQLRKLELETEAQILHRHGSESAHRQDFDPLELDRYSSISTFRARWPNRPATWPVSSNCSKACWPKRRTCCSNSHARSPSCKMG
jgi:chemosensory pili system protein ChpA (sensor histidine kinase/response regulator)